MTSRILKILIKILCRHETLKSLMSDSAVSNTLDSWKDWNIDMHDFLGESTENVQLSPLQIQSVAGRQHGLSFMMRVDESDLACPALEGMGATVTNCLTLT
jgi:hypothetical protein